MTNNERNSIRLLEYDYSQSGYYYITICTQNKIKLFGEINDNDVELNISGKMIEKWLIELKNKFKNIIIDEYIIMPNHIHFILIINNYIIFSQEQSVCQKKGRHTGLPLPKIIQWFKTMTTNEYIRNVKNSYAIPFVSKLWQRNYYEHIIRNDNELCKIRKYKIKSIKMEIR